MQITYRVVNGNKPFFKRNALFGLIGKTRAGEANLKGDKYLSELARFVCHRPRWEIRQITRT